MLPFYRGELLSEITCFEPGERLEEDFEGAGLRGHLAYRFIGEQGQTILIQQETVEPTGILRVLEPIIKRALLRQLWKRLQGIKQILEAGWVVADQK